MLNSNKDNYVGILKGDRESIDRIFDQYYPDLYRYINYRVNNDDLAEEIASEVFIRLIEVTKKNKFPETNIKGWLFLTASHIIVDHYRKVYKKPETILNEEIVDNGTDLVSEVEAKEKKKMLAAAMTNLTTEQQDVLNYRFNLEYSIEETAALMNKNENAIKQLQFRALAALKKIMSNNQ